MTAPRRSRRTRRTPTPHRVVTRRGSRSRTASTRRASTRRSSISVGTPPTATILSPTDGAFFVAGDVISFSGDATDAEDGSLPGQRVHVEHRLPARGPRASGHAADRREERLVHHPDERATTSAATPATGSPSRWSTRRGSRPPGRSLVYPTEGEPDLRHRAAGAHALRRRHRQDGAVRVRHARRLHATPSRLATRRRRHHLHVRVMVRRWCAAAHDRRPDDGPDLHRDLQRRRHTRDAGVRPGQQCDTADGPDDGRRAVPVSPGGRQHQHRRRRSEQHHVERSCR